MKFRKWWHIGNAEFRIDLSRQDWFAIEVRVGGGEGEVVQLHLAWPYLFTLFLTFSYWRISKHLDYDGRNTGVSLHWPLLTFEIWQNQNEMKRGDWRKAFLLDNMIFGRSKHTEVVKGEYDVMIPMPEGHGYAAQEHPAKVILLDEKWTWPRFRKPRVIPSAEVEMIVPIPFPGKDTMSYNLDEDALHAGRFRDCATVQVAINKVVEDVLDCRKRYPL